MVSGETLGLAVASDNARGFMPMNVRARWEFLRRFALRRRSTHKDRILSLPLASNEQRKEPKLATMINEGVRL
jgi:hypothetical protein